MANANKLNEEDRTESSAESSPQGEQYDDESPPSSTTRRPVAVFSVAQALSMVYQRREHQDRAKDEEEKALEQQRREKAKEKRQRRRQNQKVKKAKLREAAAELQPDVPSRLNDVPQSTPTTALKDDGYQPMKQVEDNQPTGFKRPHDHEDDELPPLANKRQLDDHELKRLPVKKRLRLEASQRLSSTTAEAAANDESTKTIDAKTTIQQKQTANKPVTSFIPRALLVKRNKPC